jgi:hypothetical protein
MSPILLDAFAGTAGGAVLIFLSFLLPHLGLIQHSRLEADPGHIHHLPRREANILSVAVHLVLFGILGMILGICVRAGVASTSIGSVLGAGTIVTLIFGGIILPIEGSGVFGWKEDHWLGIDLFVMNVIWVVLFFLFSHAMS